MSDVILSPNMGLPVPLVGVDPGPDWANNLNSCLGILDQHDHTTGSGVKITPAGMNINADLAINSNNLTTVRTVNFDNQVASLPGTSPDLGAVYVAGGELYYNDEAGNVVQITNSGSVNAGAGSITGLPSGTASASYSAGTKTFIWQSSTSTPASMDFGSAVFRNIVASSFGLTLNPPNALGADYSVFLPPSNSSGGSAFLVYDTSNNINVGPQVSQGITASNIANATITTTQIASATILGSNIAAATVAKTNLVALGEQITTSSGTYSITGVSFWVTPPNQTVTITTTGRPVMLMVIDGSGVLSASSGTMQARWNRDSGTIIASDEILSANLAGAVMTLPARTTVDTPTAGTHTYEWQFLGPVGENIQILGMRFIAYEL